MTLRLAERITPKADSTPVLIRLSRDNPDHWPLYGEFEDRVIRFAAEHSREIEPATLRKQLSHRYTVEPELAGYWLAMKDGKVICHLCSWVAAGYSQPFVHIFQCEADKHETVEEIMPALIGQLGQWVAVINATYAAKGEAWRIGYVEFWTHRLPEVWTRYFSGIVTAYKVMTVMRFEVPKQ